MEAERVPPLATPLLSHAAALHDHVLAALLAKEVAHSEARLASSDDHGVVALDPGK